MTHTTVSDTPMGVNITRISSGKEYEDIISLSQLDDRILADPVVYGSMDASVTIVFAIVHPLLWWLIKLSTYIDK